MISFSIVMPCFNAAATIDETIASIIAQTYGNWDLVCVDDGSDDATLEKLHVWQARDERVRIVKNPSKGPSAARNFGAAHATGDVLAFCDADDLWTEQKLAQLVDCYADPSIGGAFGRIAFFRLPGKIETFSTVPDQDLTIDDLLGENPVCTMSNVSLRKALFDRCGGFSETLVHNEDLEWLIRLIGHDVRIVPLNTLHVWYRTSDRGLSSDLIKMARSRREALQTAAAFGYAPDARNEAIYLRYLARRALRLPHATNEAFDLTLRGLQLSPRGFLFPLKRGGATAVASFLSPILPSALRRALFTQ